MYKHALDALKGPERKLLEEEFRRLFVATSLQELIVARRNALGLDGRGDGMEYLATYAQRFSPALILFIVAIWGILQTCQPPKEPEPGSILPFVRQAFAKKHNNAPITRQPTHEELIGEIKELLQELEREKQFG